MEIAREISSKYAARSSGYGAAYIVSPLVITAGFINGTRRDDTPYGTQLGSVTITNEVLGDNVSMGKTPAGTNSMIRRRGGVSFLIPSGQSSSSSWRLRFQFNAFGITEQFSPQIWLSLTDDKSLYLGVGAKAAWNWELHRDILIGTPAANDGSVQLLPVPTNNVVSRSGNGYLSFVVGSNVEFATGGSASGAGVFSCVLGAMKLERY